MKVKLAEIEFDEEIYPRKQLSQKTIESYVEAVKGGAIFPPIEVQRVRYEGKEKLICLDGKHRVYAIEEYNKELKQRKVEDNGGELQQIFEIEANLWRDEVLERDEYLEDLQIRSAVLNRRHGDRLSSADLGRVVLRIIKARPIERLNGIVNELASKFGYHQSYISRLETEEGKVADILGKRRLSRDYKIWKLLQLGWTQVEAGGVFGLAQQTVSDLTENMTTHITSIQQQFRQNRKTIDEIARFHNLDEITAWTMVLQGKNDEERFMLFGNPEYQNVEPRRFNVWAFNKRDPRLGLAYEGNIPGQIVMNVLYYYTKQGDLVVDPMAGGGSTRDACLIMGRRCRCYDINDEVVNPSEGIMKRDLAKEGFADNVKNCDLIFLDPPYWRLKREEYHEKGSDIESYKGWLSFMEKVAERCFLTTKKGGFVALLLEPFFDRKEEKRFLDLPFTVNRFFLESGFTEYYRIHVPLPPETTAHGLKYGKEEKLILDQARDLIIYKK